MPWPSTTIITTDMDAGTDSPATARAQIKQMADNVNNMMNGRNEANGVCPLDASLLVPSGNLPVVGATKGGTGQSSYAVGDILYADTTTTLTKLAAGTAGYALTSNGPGAAPSYQQVGGFPAGTRMSFQQTAAPTGWTKDTTAALNDSIMRIVTGTASSGGSTEFSTWNALTVSAAATTLTTAMIPAHTHPQNSDTLLGTGTGSSNVGSGIAARGGTTQSNTGGGGSHTHTINNGGRSIKYYDFIIASKN